MYDSGAHYSIVPTGQQIEQRALSRLNLTVTGTANRLAECLPSLSFDESSHSA
jgi:hypothetical protein